MKYLIFKTVIMVLGPAAMGIYLEIVGPTLPDLKNKLNASYEEIARVLVARSVGYFIASLTGGILADWFPKHIELTMSLAFLTGAIGTGLIPWCGQLITMALMFHLQGIAEGLIDTCNNSLCARMWMEKAATPLHALHFGFGIGAVLAPQLARPFISSFESEKDSISVNVTGISTTTSMYNTSLITGHDDVNQYSEQIYIPYTISSLITFLFFPVFLCFYILEKFTFSARPTIEKYNPTLEANNKDNHESLPLKNVNTLVAEDSGKDNMILKQVDGTGTGDIESYGCLSRIKNILSPASCAGGDASFGIKMFILIFLFYMNIVGGERAYGKFIFTYAIDCNGNFTKDQATFLNSLFWIFFTSGRGIAMILSKFIKPGILLPIELGFNISTAVVLCLWGYDVKLVLMICSAVMGMVLSPVFPAGMSWVNRYIELRGMAVAIVFTGGAAGGMVYQWLTGLFFDLFGSSSLMYVMLAYSLVLTSVYLLMVLTTFRRQSRYKSGNARV